MGLTVKEERFAEEWYATGNKSEAYRIAYDAENMSEKTINNKAYALSKKGGIRARYEQLLKEGQNRLETNIETLDSMYKESFEVAKQSNNSSGMVSATAGLAKLHGLNQPEKKAIEHSGGIDFDSEHMRRLNAALNSIDE